MSEPKTLPKPWRHTPLIHSTILSKHAGCQIFLKLENLQPSGSFKSRGVGNFLLQHLSTASQASPQTRHKTHFYISSGGNAGLACVHAAVTLKAAATIVVPLSTSAYMISKIKTAGATEVIQHGASWYECDQYLRNDIIPQAREKGENAIYVPPFDDPEVWNGNATMVEEILGQMRELGEEGGPDVLICSVGGGGLFTGIMQGLSVLHPNLRVLAVETLGAESLAASLSAGQLVTLPAITSIATSLGARTVAAKAFEYAQAEKDRVTSVVLSDEEAMEGCVRFADDERMMVEAACGVSLALCYGGRLKRYLPGLREEMRVVVVVCGGSNVTAEMLGKWGQQLGGATGV